MSFTSFCGGLPAPEVAEGVPLGYKFSWSPRGVLRAASEGASFRLTRQVRSPLVRLSSKDQIKPEFVSLPELGNPGRAIASPELPRRASFERVEIRRSG